MSEDSLDAVRAMGDGGWSQQASTRSEAPVRILVVEDDPAIARFLEKGLAAEKHDVFVVSDGARALDHALRVDTDLIILDIMIPSLDGFEVLKRLREAGSKATIIALTARGSVEDRVRGLDLGADDYLVKPFSFAELMARIRAVFRRPRAPMELTMQVGGLRLDRAKRQVAVDGQAIDFSTREFQLLEYFLSHLGEPLSRSMILDRVWGYQFDTGTNLIDVYVSYLRKKLGAMAACLKTLRGVGYVFEAPAVAEARASDHGA